MLDMVGYGLSDSCYSYYYFTVVITHGKCSLSLSLIYLIIFFFRVGLRRDEVDTWVLIGEPSRKHPAIHCVKYVKIVLVD